MKALENMVGFTVLGFDVGGVNTKAALVRTLGGSVTGLEVQSEYFPIWKRGKEQLPNVLKTLGTQLTRETSVDAVAVTMTAELSDVFFTKAEGVKHILNCFQQVFHAVPVWVLNTEAELVEPDEARREPLKVAAANWVATGWMISQMIDNCIIVDVGSTSTSVIPVTHGKISVKGKTDLEKLVCGELVYTGSLRTNIAAIVSSVPIRGQEAVVSSEFFAQSGDAHLILGNIGEQDYVVETADGRGKTRREAMARLARVICSDLDFLTEQEILDIARYLWKKQVEQIADGLKRVCSRLLSLRPNVPVVVTGMGREFLGRKAAQKAGFRRIVDVGDFLGASVAALSPSVGVALLMASELEGKIVQWKPWSKLAEA